MPSKPSTRKQLLLFDLDGVIVDSKANMALAWQAVQAELGVALPFERYFSEIGRPFQDIMVRLGLSDQGRRIEAVYRRASSHHLDDTPLFPGIEAFFERLDGAGVKLGIVTSKDASRTQLVLDRLSVGFTVVMTPNTTLRGKPSPDPLLFAVATSNVDPAQTVFVGDMDSDAEAARRAGIDYVHVAWGYGAPPHADTVVAQDTDDLFRLLLS